MKKRLASYNRKLASQAYGEIDDWLAGKPVKAVRVTRVPAPASPKEAVAARKKAGMAQPEFAEALGVTPTTIQNWEHGRRAPGGLESKVLRAAISNPAILKALRAA